MITGGNRYPEYLIFVMLFGYQAADDVTTPADKMGGSSQVEKLHSDS